MPKSRENQQGGGKILFARIRLQPRRQYAIIIKHQKVQKKVFSMLNSEEIIAAKIGAEHVLPSLIKVASHKEADGYHFNPETTIGII